ncbi:hypothetical protein LZ554_005688 [Drepanopeziza brunnea f. sp. 'monogermtubi']|nr:hypothetical protein LZ554_005688 [Drepanopeziza brunnea f. sp. 'monogermtubi']
MAQLGPDNGGPDDNIGIDGGELQKKSKGGPRKRVSQACDRCRSRKDKCDGKKPTCSTCTANGRECSYDANVKKRGLPEGYVRGLEKLWGLAIRDVDEVEDNMLSALSGNEESVESPLSIWNDETNSESLVELWRKSTISRELERLLSSQEPSEIKRKRTNTETKDLAEKGGTQQPSINVAQPSKEADISTSSWSDRTQDVRALSDFQTPPSAVDNVSLLKEPKEYESILSPSVGHVSSGTPVAAVDLPELPSETWHLLDVYFSYTHPWLPIIEKHDLLRTSYQYSQNRSNNSGSSGSGDNAVLWAAIAYAKFQHRAINNIPRALGAVGEMVWTAERMYSHARALVPNEEVTLELGHVQALLILTLANLGMGHFSRAWLLVGQAVRAAIDLRLDRPPDPKSRSRSRHVFLGCFALETLIAARLGRRPHLRSEDVEFVGLLEEDGLEEWDPWIDCLTVRRRSSGNLRTPASILSTFNRLIQVLKILNEASCLPVASNALQLNTTLLQKLHIWSQTQSPSLSFDPAARGSDHALSLLPHQYHLHNVYFTTLAMSQLLSHRHGKEAVNLEPCTRSARQAVDLMSQHSDTFGLLIVPPTYEYFVKNAYDIVHAVHSSIESTHIVLNDWRRNLDRCVDDMELAWPVFESFKSSIAHRSTSQAPRRKSQVAFDLINGTDWDADTSISGRNPLGMASYDAFDPFSPQNSRQQVEQLRLRGASQIRTTGRPSLGQSSGHGLPQNPRKIYEDLHATIGSAKRHPSNRRNAAPKPPTPQMVPQESFNIAPPTNPQLHRSLTMGSTDAEADPIFNELMRLDATEWAGNWDQSLMNLGFTDTDNMNQDFYAFCQEPDPLHQNAVLQQLVANSNAETNDIVDGTGSAFLGGSLGMGGFAVGDENEGIEAGQILQALSAAEDQRGGG